MKAVLPAAGWGTRFLPISKAVPKEMLPLGAKPVIHYVVEEAAAAGCTDVLVIINQSKESIRRYFEPDPFFEGILEKAGKTAELAEFRKPAQFFSRFRTVCASAYYATPEGWKAIGYIGNVALPSFDGPPPEVLEKLGITQTVGEMHDKGDRVTR